MGLLPVCTALPDHSEDVRILSVSTAQVSGYSQRAPGVPMLHSTQGVFPSLEISKTDLDTVLDNLLQVALLEEGGWTR